MTPTILKKLIKKLPQKPGIYIFKSGVFHSGSLRANPIYIGKASNLKNRVGNYLKTSDIRLQRMISEAKKLEFIKTESDIEALILESQYIKKYKPFFNIVMRDDKQYFYVEFTQDKFPKIFLTHQPTKIQNRKIKNQNDNSKFKILESPEYIGPFTDGNALKTALRLLRRIFPYCTCKQLHNNYCLNYHIGNCPGFCCLKKNEQRAMNNEQKKYHKNIKAVKDILSGKGASLIKDFEKEIEGFSDKKEYEKAIELKAKVEKLKRVFNNARVISKNRVMVYHNTSWVLNSLKNILDLPSLPHRIECYDIANIQGKHAVGAMVVFIDGRPDKNEYRRFKIINPNIEIPNKFKIQNLKFKTVSDLGFRSSDSRPGGDIGMLREVLSRRFNHPEWPYPDLVVVDGGRGQLNTAEAIVNSKSQVPDSKQIPNTKFPLLRSEARSTRLSGKIPVIALTKNERHIGEKIYIAGIKDPIPLNRLPLPVKNLLLHIDSEAHRFAIGYYRKLHRKDLKPLH